MAGCISKATADQLLAWVHHGNVSIGRSSRESEKRLAICKDGVVLAMYDLDESLLEFSSTNAIVSFNRACHPPVASEVKRKLASVTAISELIPIEGCDNIELAKVRDGGWSVIVPKNRYAVGDKTIYFEIDSQCPEQPPFEPLRKTHFRVRTLKLRGVISQGFCVHPSEFPSLANRVLEVDEDLTAELGITKYEEEVIEGGGCNGRTSDFPTHLIPKTDCERIQNLRTAIKNGAFFPEPMYGSEKLHGQSATYGYYDGQFYVCSRNQRLEDPESQDNWWTIARKYDLETKMKQYPGIFIQGEICGPGINGNMYQLKEKELYVFGVVDVAKKEHLSLDDLTEVAELLGLERVPITNYHLHLYPDFDVDEFIMEADGISAINPLSRQEGVVIASEKAKPLGKRTIIKVVSNAFLLEANKPKCKKELFIRCKHA